MSSWLLVLCAGVLEVVWAFGLKQSDGFTRLWPSVITVLGAAGSFLLLALAMKSLPLGTVYAVWTGIGATGTALIGMLVLGEPANAMRIGCIALIVAGIIGLKFSS